MPNRSKVGQNKRVTLGINLHILRCILQLKLGFFFIKIKCLKNIILFTLQKTNFIYRKQFDLSLFNTHNNLTIKIYPLLPTKLII